VVVIATSRRTLHVSGENEHPVPPLGLPDRVEVSEVQSSGAVKLFEQRAKMVRPGFAVTAANVDDVVQVCRGLDGLPLAIELAAARCKLLSPAALLARLDTVLELKDAGVDRPTRQQTLRATIGWSYDLLTDSRQACFRRLGVFAGGADLDAVSAVTADVLGDTDALDVLSDLVDVSLASVLDDDQGEPRVALLETIRAFALQQLRTEHELRHVSGLHAQHYVDVAREVHRLKSGTGAQLLAARVVFERELENFRAALTWSMTTAGGSEESSAPEMFALQLAGRLGWLWWDRGYYTEGRRWLEEVIRSAGQEDSAELAQCLSILAWLQDYQDGSGGVAAAAAAVDMLRRVGGDKQQLGDALLLLGLVNVDAAASRAAFDEAVLHARANQDNSQLGDVLSCLADLEADEGNNERALDLHAAALSIVLDLGKEWSALRIRVAMAGILRRLNRPRDAHEQLTEHIPRVLRFADAGMLIYVAETYGMMLAELGDYEHAVRLLGAADAGRDRVGMQRVEYERRELAECFGKVRANLAERLWDQMYDAGQKLTVRDVLGEAHSAVTGRER
jgi:predicted ATPase